MGFLGHFRGVRLGKGRVHFGKTGTDIPLDRAFLKSSLAIAKINLAIFIRRFFQSRAKGTLAFTPEIPGPWYNARFAANLAGLKIVKSEDEAECVFVFEDKTHSHAGQAHFKGPSINARISDISKKHVATVFERIFGYSLSVDPLSYHGAVVQKSDANATHDGQIVQCPIEADDLIEGCVYQKLIDSTPNGTQSEEMRAAYIGEEIPVVFYKFKDLDKRFTTTYARVDIRRAQDVFTPDETLLLIEFCGAMGLDFGALDVMRDKHDGRIYVVDVNKTCMPVLILPLREQIQSLDKISQSLLRLVTRIKTV